MEDWKQIEEIVRGCEIDMTDPRNISAAIMIEGEEDSLARRMADFIENSKYEYPLKQKYSFFGPESNLRNQKYKFNRNLFTGMIIMFGIYQLLNKKLNGNFTWNTYDVEGQTTPVTNFVLRRDNANSGVYTVVGSVSGSTTIFNDANYSTYQTIANWRIDAAGFNCTPSYFTNSGTQTTVLKSKSNTRNNRGVNVKSIESNFSVYPNPTSGDLNINFTNSVMGEVSVKIISVLGEEMYEETFVGANKKINIDLSKYEDGIYLVKLTINNSMIVKPVVKN